VLLFVVAVFFHVKISAATHSVGKCCIGSHVWSAGDG
jgi:hypothetical protein